MNLPEVRHCRKKLKLKLCLCVCAATFSPLVVLLCLRLKTRDGTNDCLPSLASVSKENQSHLTSCLSYS